MGTRGWGTCVVGVLLVLVAGGPARADEKDTYVLLQGGAGYVRTRSTFEPAQGVGRAEALLGVASYRGLTDTLHVGASLTGTWARGLRYPGARVPLSTGASPEGTFAEDVRLLSLGVLGHYRFDSGRAWAPFAQLELGGAWESRSERVQRVPAPWPGLSYEEPVTGTNELAPQGALQLGFEMRVRDHYSVSLGVQLRMNPLERSSWRLQVPLMVGGVFR